MKKKILNAAIFITVVTSYYACQKTEADSAPIDNANAIVYSSACNSINRPLIHAQLIPFGILSQPRVGMSIATAGTKVVFAGAVLSAAGNSSIVEYGSSRVDIFDWSNQTWSTAELSAWRSHMAAVSAGNKIFFAGGRLGDGSFDQLFSTVDIYDVYTGSWSVANLSQPRAYIAAVAVGDKVFFAGGEKDISYNTSNVVDIYNLTSNSWTTHTLSEARSYISAVSVNDKVYFAGGHREDRFYLDPTDMIDIYDNATNEWSISFLKKPMGSPGVIVNNQNIYWAEGCYVESKNVITASSSTSNLFAPGEWINTEGQNVVSKGDKIIFFRHDNINGSDKFDIYNTTTATWSIGVIPQKIYGASIIAANNTIYVAGGSFSNLSNQVWRLEF